MCAVEPGVLWRRVLGEAQTQTGTPVPTKRSDPFQVRAGGFRFTLKPLACAHLPLWWDGEIYLLTWVPMLLPLRAPTRRQTTSTSGQSEKERSVPSLPDPMPNRSLPARLSLGSQQSSSASSSAPRAPLRAHMLPWPGSGASPPGLSPWPQPRRRRLRRRRRLLAVLPGARPRQPVPSVGAAAATLHRGPLGAWSAMGAGRPLSSQARARPSLRFSGSGAPSAHPTPEPWLRSCATEGECAKRRSQRPARSRPSPSARLSAPAAAASGSGALAGPLPQCQALPFDRFTESARGGALRAAGRGLGGRRRSLRGALEAAGGAVWGGAHGHLGAASAILGPFWGDLARRCVRRVGKPGRWIIAGSGVCSIFFSKN